MKSIDSNNFPRKKIIASLIVGLLIGGCGFVKPRPVTDEEVVKRVKSDTQLMYQNQEPIAGPVSLEEAMARALKYNLDYRLKKMESALALGLTDYASYDMLPKLAANAGYRARDNDSGGTSLGIVDRQPSLRPSTSEERRHSLASLEVSWNVLDFGVSYYRARQQADQVMIAEERRRKVVQNIIQDVRSAFWRALGAQRLEAQAKAVLRQADEALARSRQAEVTRAISPGLALNYQRALLDATSLLNQRRQDLLYAKTELAALMTVPAGQEFTLANTNEGRLPPAPCDISQLEELALMKRPELRQEDFKTRITSDEARKQLLGMLPGINLDISKNYDSNNLLFNNSWLQGGLGVSWTLMRLAALPALNRAQDQQVETDTARRLALSLAVLTQVRVGAERYRLALEDYRLADSAAQVDRRLADYTHASVKAKLETELEEIRTEARAVLGAYQRANAYVNTQVSFGRLYNTVGEDPLPDDFDDENVKQLSQRLHSSLRNIELEWFLQKTGQNSCGAKPEAKLLSRAKPVNRASAVAVRVLGIESPIKREQARKQISEMLVQQGFVIDEAKGLPVIVQPEPPVKRKAPKARPATPPAATPVVATVVRKAPRKKIWVVSLQNQQGQTLGSSRYVPDASKAEQSESKDATDAAVQAASNLRLWSKRAEGESK